MMLFGEEWHPQPKLGNSTLPIALGRAGQGRIAV